MTTIIEVEALGLQPDTGEDATPYAAEALRLAAAAGDGAVVRFRAGRYDFRPERAYERQLFISNHDQDRDRRAAFPVERMSGIEVDGGGARFVMHGWLTPFIVDGCRQATLRNFSVDWERPFLAQGTIVQAGDGFFELDIAQEHPFRLDAGRLLFEGEGGELPCHGMNEFDTETGGPASGEGDRFAAWRGYGKLSIERTGARTVRFSNVPGSPPRVGNVMVLRWGMRDNPGVFIRSSEDVTLAGIALHHAGGMGIIAQRSRNILLDRVVVTPAPGTGRLFSLPADAAHFSLCGGSLVLRDCLFEGQLDDSCNVHGIYAQIAAVESPVSVVARLVHEQQTGVETAAPGERIRFVDNETLLPLGENRAAAVERINREYFRISLEKPLPDAVRPGHVVENLDWMPELLIEGCTFRRNRARGVLATTAGRVVIRRNRFEVPGSAVKIAGDANSWYESGAVRDVRIEDNLIVRPNTCTDWGRAAIDIDPEIAVYRPGLSYHTGIRIERNRFLLDGGSLLFARGASGLAVRGNTVEDASLQPADGLPPDRLTAAHCESVMLEDNRTAGSGGILPDSPTTTNGEWVS